VATHWTPLSDKSLCSRQLEAGEYDWAHLAYSIWPERVKKLCKIDRSVAIAHGLEQICEVEIKKSKKKRAKKEKDNNND
jgi:hypothetical protein